VSFGSDSLPFATSFARSTGKCMSVELDSLLALTFAETSRDLRPSVTETTHSIAETTRSIAETTRSIAETAPSEISCNPYTSIFSSGTTQNSASKARSKKSCTGEPSFNPESLHVKTQKRLGSDSPSLSLSLPPSPRPLSLPPSAVRPFRSPKCRSRWYSSAPNTPPYFFRCALCTASAYSTHPDSAPPLRTSFDPFTRASTLMESLRENKLFDIRLIGAARSGAGSLFSTHEKTALLSYYRVDSVPYPLLQRTLVNIMSYVAFGRKPE
jgi:hypothetical protein